MAIGHADPTHNRTNNPYKALICATQIEVFQMRGAIEPFFRRTIHRAIIVPRKPTDRVGGKHVGLDYMAAKIRHELTGRRRRAVEPAKLL